MKPTFESEIYSDIPLAYKYKDQLNVLEKTYAHVLHKFMKVEFEGDLESIWRIAK